MALMTTRPFKHPKTGIYYLRRAVPADLLSHIGKREEKESLGTRVCCRLNGLRLLAFSLFRARSRNAVGHPVG